MRRRSVGLWRLGRVLPFLFLFVRQKLLLIRVFLQQLLRLLLMLLLDQLFFSRIRLLLREFGVFLLLQLLDSLPFLLLLRAELILLLLVLPVQLGIRGGLNNETWRSWSLVRMDCRKRSLAIGLRWRRRLLPGSSLSGSFRCSLLSRLLLRGLLPGFFVG